VSRTEGTWAMDDLTFITERFGDLSRWQACPPYWTAKPDAGRRFMDTLREASIHAIGRSAGGREVWAIEYGAREPLTVTSNSLHSSLAGEGGGPDPTRIFPESFYGQGRRRRPVLAIQGAIHGGELAGTVAALNLCRVIETGRDLRDRAWPRLQELARDARILILPWLNADGAARWPIPNTSGIPAELLGLCLHGVWRDGRPCRYGEHQRCYPLPLDQLAFLGCYFNAAGFNLQYDFGLPQRQPETLAWMEYFLAERPDGVLVCHSNAGSMMGPPEYYLPLGHQHELSRLAGAVRLRLMREGFATGRLSWAGLPGMGRPLFDQSTAVYHVCGALPMLCEFPHGGEDAPFTCEQMLDIGLLTLEEILFYAHHDGLRPYEWWDKVKKSLPPREGT